MLALIRQRSLAAALLPIPLGMTIALAIGAPASAQEFETRTPGFQDVVSGSLESQIVDRLTATGQYEPGDLPRLARLAVLESIATLVNARTDLPESAIGSRLTAEITTLWDAAQLFYESVSEAPLDAAALARAQPLYFQMAAARRQVEATLGELPVLSERAFAHLQAFSRMETIMGSVMSSLDATLVGSRPAPVDRSLEPDSLRREAQLLANDLVELSAAVAQAGGKPGATSRLSQDLDGLLALIQDFARKLSLEPSYKELADTYRLARHRMWRVEAEINTLGWPAGLQERWRVVRARANSISDAFGSPRVIAAVPTPPAVSSNRELAAQIDRAVAWVDEFLAESGPELRKSPAGSRFLADASRLRKQVLRARRMVIANESTEQITRQVQEILAANRQLIASAAAIGPSIERTDIVTRFREPALAINKLHGLLAQPGAGDPTH